MRFLELPHLITLLLIILLIFGASKLPDIARNLGKSAKIVKEDLKELREDKKDSENSKENLENHCCSHKHQESSNNDSGDDCNCGCQHQ